MLDYELCFEYQSIEKYSIFVLNLMNLLDKACMRYKGDFRNIYIIYIRNNCFLSKFSIEKFEWIELTSFDIQL